MKKTLIAVFSVFPLFCAFPLESKTIEQSELSKFYKMIYHKEPKVMNELVISFGRAFIYFGYDPVPEFELLDLHIGVPAMNCSELHQVITNKAVYIPKNLIYFLRYFCGQSDSLSYEIFSEDNFEYKERSQEGSFEHILCLPTSLWEEYINYCWEVINNLTPETILFLLEEGREDLLKNILEFINLSPITDAGFFIAQLEDYLHKDPRSKKVEKTKLEYLNNYIAQTQQKIDAAIKCHLDRRDKFMLSMLSGHSKLSTFIQKNLIPVNLLENLKIFSEYDNINYSLFYLSFDMPAPHNVFLFANKGYRVNEFSEVLLEALRIQSEKIDMCFSKLSEKENSNEKFNDLKSKISKIFSHYSEVIKKFKDENTSLINDENFFELYIKKLNHYFLGSEEIFSKEDYELIQSDERLADIRDTLKLTFALATVWNYVDFGLAKPKIEELD